MAPDQHSKCSEVIAAKHIAILYYISKLTAALELLTVATNTNVWRRILNKLSPLDKYNITFLVLLKYLKELLHMSTHCHYQGGLYLKPTKFEHIFVAVITFFLFLLCKYF